jgi:hypothetical protein
MGSALLTPLACSSTSPTAATSAVATTTATAAQLQDSTSAIVRGTVRDSAGRLMANAQVECLGEVECTGLFAELSAEGHEHRATTTDANGVYETRVISRPGGARDGFLMNANARGYQVEWRRVAFRDPSCTSDQSRCALTVDFTLADLVDE